jgi:baculoviral IAP repeat-containing protein 7/8
MAPRQQQCNTSEQIYITSNVNTNFVSDDFNKESDRLTTFDYCSNTIVFNLRRKFAIQGLYFLNERDQVKCHFCHIVLEKWQTNDDPLADHLKFSPRCSLLNRQPTDNVPLIAGELEQELPPVSYDVCGVDYNGNSRYSYPEYYLDIQRMQTFETWPTSMKQTPFDLVQCGFFYTGMADRVICFCCGLGLGNWEETDTPLAEHVNNNTNCEYLRSTFNEDLIYDALHPIVKKQPIEDSEELNGDDNEDSEKLCKICFDNPSNVAFVPCGHVFCQNCTMFMKNCAVCRANITKRLKLYF